MFSLRSWRTSICLIGIVGMAMGTLASSNQGEIAHDFDSFVQERATSEQRQLAALQVEWALTDAGFEPVVERYRVPNSHWALDFVMPPMVGQNVSVELPATAPTDKTIIVGAHFDSKLGSPGADDNASGTYAVIALADLLSVLPERNANVVFVLFDQEEQGGIGSQAFANNWQASGRALHSMHNVDMIGYDGNGDGVFDLDMPDGPIAEAYIESAKELEITIERTSFNSSDHVSFRALGYATVCLSENFSGDDANPAYHSSRDVDVDREYMQRGTDLMLGALKRLIAQ